MTSGSGVSGDTKVWPGVTPTDAQQARKLASQRAVWKPQAVAAAIPSRTSRPTAVGRAPKASGSAKGVWVKCTMRTSGRAAARKAGTRHRW